MGLFDGLLGGVVGAEMATVVNGLIEKHGGVQGIIAQLEQQGLGATARSWVGMARTSPSARIRSTRRSGRTPSRISRQRPEYPSTI